MNTSKFTILLLDQQKQETRRMALPASLLIGLVLFCIAGIGGVVHFGVQLGTFTFHTHKLQQQEKKLSRLTQKYATIKDDIERASQQTDKIVCFDERARRVFGLNPIDAQIREVGTGGVPDMAHLVHTQLSNPHLQNAQALVNRTKKLQRKIRLEHQCVGEIKEYVNTQYRLFSDRPSIPPTGGRITSTYGWRIHPIFGVRSFHEGLDISNAPWAPVRATGDGVVKYVGEKPRYGVLVYIRHYQSGFTSGYAHLNKALVKKGELVKRGDIIGYVGNTGLTTGPHLHYEVIKSGRHVNPIYYILPIDTLTD